MNSDNFKIESGVTSGLEWSAKRLPKQGEKKCGDVCLVEKYRDKVLIATIDGLGHGKSAARASTRAKYLIKENNHESLINVVNHCHKKLRSTRGVVMSLALLDAWEQTITWLGIGNVKGILLPGKKSEETNAENIIRKHGIVGYQMPSLQASILPISKGDMLIFTTDGVKNDFLKKINVQSSPKENVEYIASNYFKRSDDSLILVARFIGEENDGNSG